MITEHEEQPKATRPRFPGPDDKALLEDWQLRGKVEVNELVRTWLPETATLRKAEDVAVAVHQVIYDAWDEIYPGCQGV